MKQYNCIIIEDEPLAAELLEEYVSQVNFVHLLAVCNDAIQALEFMRTEKVDLIFLDIHLPKLKGLDFLASLKNPPSVIITTAYNEYAIQGYEYNVIDYLLKPIDFGRFIKAINKLKNINSPEQAMPSVLAEEPERPFIFVNADKKRVKVYLDEIVYLEGDREYVKIVTRENSIRTKMQISKADSLTVKGNFIRVHRSFIVASKEIVSYSATDIEVKGKSIPIGRSYKELVLTTLNSLA